MSRGKVLSLEVLWAKKASSGSCPKQLTKTSQSHRTSIKQWNINGFKMVGPAREGTLEYQTRVHSGYTMTKFGPCGNIPVVYILVCVKASRHVTRARPRYPICLVCRSWDISDMTKACLRYPNIWPGLVRSIQWLSRTHVAISLYARSFQDSHHSLLLMHIFSYIWPGLFQWIPIYDLG